MQTSTNGKVRLRVRLRRFCAGVVRTVDIVELAKRGLAKSARKAEINLAAERIAPRKL
jgi:hypothetical protein